MKKYISKDKYVFNTTTLREKNMKAIYLDNGATSFPKAPSVGDAMKYYIDKVGANINRYDCTVS